MDVEQPNYEKEINAFYNKAYKLYAKDVRGLGWSSKEIQRIRFEIFLNICDLNDKTVLDIGSGFGDLAYLLKEKYPSMHYVGYDINENFIKECHPEKNIRFEKRNILTNPPKEKFHAIYSSGALNSAFEGNDNVMKQLLKTCFHNCTAITAVNMLSNYTDPDMRFNDLHYYDPCMIFTYAKTLTKNVVLLHHYLPNDFTIVLFK